MKPEHTTMILLNPPLSSYDREAHRRAIQRGLIFTIYCASMLLIGITLGILFSSQL